MSAGGISLGLIASVQIVHKTSPMKTSAEEDQHQPRQELKEHIPHRTTPDERAM